MNCEPRYLTPKTNTTSRYPEAERYLGQRDPVLKGLIKKFGPCTLQPYSNRLEALVRAIIWQRIPVSRADIICDQLIHMMPDKTMTPEAILALSSEQLQSCGLNGVKGERLRRVASAVANGTISLDDIHDGADDDVMDYLRLVKGIGPWTVHIFLMFGLGRLDVFAAGDLVLRRAVMEHYRLPQLPTERRLNDISEQWRPYRSIASWYLWRASSGPDNTAANNDVVFRKGLFTLAEQKKICDKVLSIEPGFYVPVLANGNRMNLRMNCFGHDWSARTYQYSKTREDGAEVAAVPAFLRAVARRILKETGYWQGPGNVPAYDICIANLYEEKGGKLGEHPDKSETKESLAAGYPVISLSIGASAIFTIGGPSKKDPQFPRILESGDVVLFGRSMRLARHGVRRIVRGTTPPELGFANPGRLNLTFRIL